jgi:hypothetical protein
MSLLVQSTPATLPDAVRVKLASVLLAAVFTILAVAQLYSFEDFPGVIASFWLPGDVPDQLVAALLVALEVLAIPFLLFMRVSPAMRIASMLAGWVVVVGWLAIALWINLTINVVTNSGVLGETIPVAPGWWMIAFFAVLAVMMGWVSWQMMPVRAATSSSQENGQ